MKEQTSQQCCQDFAAKHVLGGPLIVVNDEDAFAKDIKQVEHDRDNKNLNSELQNKLRMVNEKLSEFHRILEENEALKVRNNELESQLAKKDEMPWEKIGHLSFSLDESPYERIQNLEDELRAAKMELALARTREDWFKQHISRAKLDNIYSKTDTGIEQDVSPVDEKNWKNTFKFSRSASNLKRDNSSTFLAKRFNSDFQSDQSSDSSGLLTGLANTITRHRKFASSIALSLASRARSEREESPSVNATWGNIPRKKHSF